MEVRIKRAYDPPAPADGYRILVDRLWPRGLSKQRAAVDEWLRDAAPSAELRRWFGHQPARWAEFERRYLLELEAEPAAAAVARLRSLIARRRVTLLHAARDEAHNNAVVLRGNVAPSRKRRRRAAGRRRLGGASSRSPSG